MAIGGLGALGLSAMGAVVCIGGGGLTVLAYVGSFGSGRCNFMISACVGMGYAVAASATVTSACAASIRSAGTSGSFMRRDRLKACAHRIRAERGTPCEWA